MAQRGGQLGNTNAAKAKRWQSALDRLFAQSPERLAKIAEATVSAAEAGEPWAITEIGNRLDGKPVQQVDMNTNTQPMTLSDALLAHIAMGGKPDEYNGETVQ